MAIKFVLYSSDFHGGNKYATHRTAKAALRNAARHAKECTCGGPAIVVRASAKEIEALGAYAAVSGDTVVRLPEGDFVVDCDDESEGV